MKPLSLLSFAIASVFSAGTLADTQVIHAGELLAVPGNAPLKEQTIVIVDGKISEIKKGFVSVKSIDKDATLVDLSKSFVMLASLFYGISANYTKKYLSNIKPLVLAAGSQISATLVLLPISLLFLPDSIPSIEAINSVIVWGIVCTGFAYIIFFRLISTLGPTKAISVTYLIPAFGLFWGATFLDEKITATMLFGCSLILFGVALTTGLISFRRRLAY